MMRAVGVMLKVSFPAGPGMEMSPEFRRRSSKDPFEHAIELGQRLETDVIRDLADSPVWVEELGSSVFQADPRDIVSEL